MTRALGCNSTPKDNTATGEHKYTHCPALRHERIKGQSDRHVAEFPVAPVAVESGKAKRARFRWARDHRLHEAFNLLADSSRRHDPWAADINDRARARGASHQHAARILGRAWCQGRTENRRRP